jgi:hypothetical protein
METGTLPDINDNEYDQIFLAYLDMIEQILQNKTYGPLLQAFLENIISWGQCV